MCKKEKKQQVIQKRFSIIFSRNFFIVLAILIELALFITLMVLCSAQYYIFRIIVEILAVLFSIRIVVCRSTPSYKIIWLFFMAVLPVVGLLFYVLFAEDKFTVFERKKLKKISLQFSEATKSKLYHNELDNINRDEHPDLYNIASYIANSTGLPLHKNTHTEYFPWGDDAFPVMLETLKKAKHYIFIEYFIIQEGKMWNAILDILKEKAKEGLDIRIMYDDFGCISTLPRNYCDVLNSYGIKARKYAPLRPFLDVRMNNRDHRKIMVIDGHTGFTGGINLADEYINEVVRFGRWKDNAILIQGQAVFSLTVMFLSTWCFLENNYEIDYSKYFPKTYINEIPPIPDDKGYVQSYYCIPFIDEAIGQQVYIDMCLKAKKYLYITTPYLILDDEMRNAIALAAKNGVDVRIITPHIPDKKIVFELTRSNYLRLVEDGVKIYEYTPGFIHAKTFVSDDTMATVGTINLDYRSLYLHMENGVFIYEQEMIKDIKQDLLNTINVSEEITLEELKKTKWYRKLFRAILKIFAPLM